MVIWCWCGWVGRKQLFSCDVTASFFVCKCTEPRTSLPLATAMGNDLSVAAGSSPSTGASSKGGASTKAPKREKVRGIISCSPPNHCPHAHYFVLLMHIYLI